MPMTEPKTIDRHGRMFDNTKGCYRYSWIVDPGHGWLRVERQEVLDAVAAGVRISEFSFDQNAVVFLEEDCDATAFIEYMKFTPEELAQIPVIHTDNFNRNQPRWTG